MSGPFRVSLDGYQQQFDYVIIQIRSCATHQCGIQDVFADGNTDVFADGNTGRSHYFMLCHMTPFNHLGANRGNAGLLIPATRGAQCGGEDSHHAAPVWGKPSQSLSHRITTGLSPVMTMTAV